MNKKIATLIAGIFLVSLVSAGLVTYLSNVISGEVEVKGPVFYISSNHGLLVNNDSTSIGTYTIIGQEQELFKTDESFNGIDFYKPTLEFVVNLAANNFSSDRGLDLEFGYLKTNGNSVTICEIQYISINNNGTINVPCTPKEDLQNIENLDEFYFSIRGMAEDYIEYKINKKTSYVEITGVAE